MTATKNLETAAELRLDVGIGDDGPFPAVVTLIHGGWGHGGIPRWNGWIAEPRFDRTTVDRIAAMLDRDRAAGFEADKIEWAHRCAVCGENGVGRGSMAGYVHRWGPVEHGEYLPAAILTRPTEPDWRGETITPDDDGLYAIGSYGWCWYEWEAE